MKAILVNERNGAYTIHPNADTEVWEEVLQEVTKFEFVEFLTGWGEWYACYKIDVDGFISHYFVAA